MPTLYSKPASQEQTGMCTNRPNVSPPPLKSRILRNNRMKRRSRPFDVPTVHNRPPILLGPILLLECRDDPLPDHAFILPLDLRKVFPQRGQREKPGMFQQGIKRRTFPRDFIQTKRIRDVGTLRGYHCRTNPCAVCENSSGNSGGSPSTIALSCAKTLLNVSGG